MRIEAERCREFSCRNNRPDDWLGAQVSDRACSVYPAPHVVARVLTEAVPNEPPSRLAAFVVPVMEEGAVADWLLTQDSIAFGPHDLATEFKDWRGTWQQRWELDTVQGFQCLFRLVVDAGAINEPSQRLAEKFALTSLSVEESVLSPSRSVLIPDLVERARSLAAEVETTGVGLVDTTEDAGAAGLLAGWPLSSTTRLLARDRYCCVNVHPRHGLCIEVYDDHGDTIEQVDDLTEVIFEGMQAIVHTADRTVEFDADQVRPLAWIALGARSYRVRRVPAVIVVARTIARLPEAARFAIERGKDLVLSGVAPVVVGQ